MNKPVPHAGHPGPTRRGLVAVWLLAAAACAVLLVVIRLSQGPADDPDPPVGYAVVDATGSIRYRTLAPEISELREVSVVLEAL